MSAATIVAFIGCVVYCRGLLVIRPPGPRRFAIVVFASLVFFSWATGAALRSGSPTLALSSAINVVFSAWWLYRWLALAAPEKDN